MKNLFITIIIALALSTNALAAANCMHYKRAIICVGDNKYKVLDECGEPVSKNTVGEVGSRHNRLNVEEWVYKYHGKIYVLKIVGDKIKDIKKVN